MSDQPKYPVGTLLRHRASGQKVIVTDVPGRTKPDGSPFTLATMYMLESAPGQWHCLPDDAAVDLRYEPVVFAPDKDKLLATPLRELRFSVRIQNCLELINVKTLGDLVKLTEDDLLMCRGFSTLSLSEVRYKLDTLGLTLRPLPPDAFPWHSESA